MGNTAIATNPPLANIRLSQAGSDWNWMMFCVMGASAIIIGIMAQFRERGQRAFHYIGLAVFLSSSLSYFCMASDLGEAPVPVQFIRSGTLGVNWVLRGVLSPTRSIWYARYCDWVIGFPLLFLLLVLVTGLPLSEVLLGMFLSFYFVVNLLVGAFIPTRYKWGPYAFGVFALFGIWWILLGPSRISAKNLGSRYHGVFLGGALWLSMIWLVYPIIWGVSEGGNVIKVTSEMIAYGILDLLIKPVLIFGWIVAIRELDYKYLLPSSVKYSDTAVIHQARGGGPVQGPVPSAAGRPATVEPEQAPPPQSKAEAAGLPAAR